MADDKRLALLQSTVRAVAKYGMKDVSTRSISGDAGVNDAYIYRCFADKEDMLMQAYLLENEKFMRHVMRRIDLLQGPPALEDEHDRCKVVFHTAWRYLLNTPDVCRFFMYYYHSPNFERYAQEEYRKQLDVLVNKIVRLFDSTDAAKHCLYALFVLLNSFALQVVNGELSDCQATENRVIEMSYSAVCSQMKQANEKERLEGSALKNRA